MGHVLLQGRGIRVGMPGYGGRGALGGQQVGVSGQWKALYKCISSIQDTLWI